MEKLIELLNEYKEEKNIYNTDMDGQLEIGNYRYVNYPCSERLCSKKYEFIKWLVDNDKIDVESYCRITTVERKGEKDVYRDEVDSLLMLLAIQDSPIEYLISILR